MIHAVLVSSANRAGVDLRVVKDRAVVASRHAYRRADDLRTASRRGWTDCGGGRDGLRGGGAPHNRRAASRFSGPALIAGRRSMSHHGTIIHLMYGDRYGPRDSYARQSARSQYGRVAAVHHGAESCRRQSLGATTSACRTGPNSLQKFYRRESANRRPIPSLYRII